MTDEIRKEIFHLVGCIITERRNMNQEWAIGFLKLAEFSIDAAEFFNKESKKLEETSSVTKEVSKTR